MSAASFFSPLCDMVLSPTSFLMYAWLNMSAASFFFVPFAVSLECCNSCDGILLSIVISNAGTDFNSNLLIQCLEFVFSNLFKISDMMVFVCWRPVMTTVLNLQFSYIVIHSFF